MKTQLNYTDKNHSIIQIKELKKTVAFIIAFMLVPCFVWSQQQAVFTQYMFNQLVINPAHAGNTEGTEFTLVTREQWVGFEGAPSTQSLTINHPTYRKQLGLGLSLTNDKAGVAHETGFYGSFAYRIPFDNSQMLPKLRPSNRKHRKSKYQKGNPKFIHHPGVLSFGLQIGGSQYRLALSEALVNANGLVQVDPVFQQDDISRWLLSVGAGVQYVAEHFFVGLSAPILTNNAYGRKNSNSRRWNHYFLNAGIEKDIDHDLEVQQNLLLRYVRGVPLGLDINTMLFYKNKMGAGLSYRILETVAVVLRAHIKNNWKLGYSVDLTTNESRNAFGTSHEIMVSYMVRPLNDASPKRR